MLLREGHYPRHLSRLQARLGEATANAKELLESVGAEIFARNSHTLYLWAALPGVADSLTVAQALLPQKIVIAPGRIFGVNSSQVSRWSPVNVGAVADPRFTEALRATLQRLNT